MGMYNLLDIQVVCPNCQKEVLTEAEFKIGFLNLDKYRLGEKLRWNDNGKGLRVPKVRPTNGDYEGKAYAECPTCYKEFWLQVSVKDDILAMAQVLQIQAE
jgi:predicted  nucleic acid-binding Zn ribbon protein